MADVLFVAVPMMGTTPTLRLGRPDLSLSKNICLVYAYIPVMNDLRKLGVPATRIVTRDGAWILVIICSEEGAHYLWVRAFLCEDRLIPTSSLCILF
ncbi:hypothetical protein CVT25_007228 [Psilocybe cyanescens]|uniref:Uncharacterized protein n=1 Tax=Psilocybe cyanescens TaxID=93625 RepID=A0A409XVS9_PSICY|nr:hypothetical protein CVT25_007228 [Psilocybe cyanescens]